MATTTYQGIKTFLRQLYLEDDRPWLVGFSGGKDSTMLASLVFDTCLSLAPDERVKPISVVCTDTRVEIPAIVEMVEGTLEKMRKCSEQHGLGIDVNLLKPPSEQSFWVNSIGRGYPPPNRTFRWCTQRMEIDPVNTFVQQRLGHWGEAILHLGARRSESSTRAQAMGSLETRNGLRRHPDLPRVWVSNPIEFLTTEDVWAYLLQKPNPWGSDNRSLYKLYAAQATVNARSTLIPAHQAAATAGSVAGHVLSLNAIRLAKGCSPVAMNAWKSCSDSARRCCTTATRPTTKGT